MNIYLYTRSKSLSRKLATRGTMPRLLKLLRKHTLIAFDSSLPSAQDRKDQDAFAEMEKRVNAAAK